MSTTTTLCLTKTSRASTPLLQIKSIIDELKESTLFNEEEKIAIQDAQEGFADDLAQQYTYILLHTIRVAMCRYGQDCSHELLEYHDKLLEMIQHKMSYGVCVDDYIRKFEDIEDLEEVIESSKKGVVAIFQQATQNLCHTANQLNAANCERVANTSSAAIAIQELRLQGLQAIQEQHKDPSLKERVYKVAKNTEQASSEAAAAHRMALNSGKLAEAIISRIP